MLLLLLVENVVDFVYYGVQQRNRYDTLNPQECMLLCEVFLIGDFLWEFLECDYGVCIVLQTHCHI